MERFLRLSGGLPGFGQVLNIDFGFIYLNFFLNHHQSAPVGDTPMVDTAEQVYISSLALLKVRNFGILSFDYQHIIL